MVLAWGVWALVIAVNLALLPYFAHLMIVALAAMLVPRTKKRNNEPCSRLAIIIPAHNEASGIEETIRSCLAADYPRQLFRVIVIADNCSDQTAAIARQAGARVVERSDPTRRSKGHALEYLLDILSETGELAVLDAVVIVDADTSIDPTLLTSFDRELSAGCDWIQCYYTVAEPDRTWRTRLLNYAFSLYNGVTLLGQNAIGISAGLRGNGMCFSTRGLKRRPWMAYGLVEDVEYEWTIRVAGEYIKFLPDSRVYGAMPATQGPAAASQRRRWEFGRRQVRAKFAWPVLLSQNLGIWAKVASYLQLTLPSLASLVIAYLIAVCLNAWCARGLQPLAGVQWPFWALNAFMTTALGAYALAPFFALNLPWRYAAYVLYFPVYLIWKLRILVSGRPREWVRTAREPRVSHNA
jgi:cellulose synthase/poly-beta-1,6-N-acetylglucosamine synthase-like glycosyltransferase